MSKLYLPPRFSIGTPTRTIDAEMKYDFCGRVARIEIWRNGLLKSIHEGTPNMILTNGKTAFLHYGLLDSMGAVRIGTSDSAVAATQTTLGALSASSDTWIYGPSPDGFEYNGTRYNVGAGQVFYRKTAEFPVETGPFTYREIGIASGTAGTTVLTRAIPTPISGIAEDIVRITYELGATLTAPQTIATNTQFISGWDTTGTNRLEGWFQSEYSWTEDRGYEFGGHIVPHLGISDQLIKAGAYGLPLSPAEGSKPTLAGEAMPPHATTWGYSYPVDSIATSYAAVSDDTITFGDNSVTHENSFLPAYQSNTFQVHGFWWCGLYCRFVAPQPKSSSLRLVMSLTRNCT